MNRRDFQVLAELRLEEAKLLLEAKKYAGAYYLAGYAVECALKACICKRTRRHDYPDKDFANKVYTHKLDPLMIHAGLQKQFDQAREASPELDANWSIARDWDEKARYQHKRKKAEAQAHYDAIADPANGVLSWIKSAW